MSLSNQNKLSYKLPYTFSQDNWIKNIEHLNAKLEACTREITYFDLYKITRVVTDPDRFQAQVNSLPAYASLVVNTPVSINNIQYVPGDIIIKNNDGSTEHIKAQSGGVFYPSEIKKTTNGDNYTFTFSFMSYMPTTETSTISSNTDKEWDASSSYAKNMTFSDLTGESVGSPYNFVFATTQKLDKQAIDVVKSSSNNEIYPIVHAYCDGEEVYVDQAVVLNGDKTKWLITMDMGELMCDVVVK